MSPNLTRRAVLAASVVGLPACASVRSVVIEHDTAGSVRELRRGQAVATASGRFVPADGQTRSRAGSIEFEINRLVAKVKCSNTYLEWEFDNRSNESLRFGFDRVQASGAAAGEFQPLAASHFQGLLAKDDPARTSPRPTLPSPLDLAPSRTLLVIHGASFGGIYPSGRVFGAQWDQEGRLSQTGVGNVLRIQLPLRRGNEDSILEFELKATAAHSRFSYY